MAGMNLNLATVNLEVSDLVRSHAFYAKVLGLQEDKHRSHPPHFSYLKCPGADVTIQERQPGQAMGSTPTSMEIGFAVDDVKAWQKRLADSGVAMKPQAMGWGDAIELNDPDGHRIIIYKLHAD